MEMRKLLCHLIETKYLTGCTLSGNQIFKDMITFYSKEREEKDKAGSEPDIQVVELTNKKQRPIENASTLVKSRSSVVMKTSKTTATPTSYATTSHKTLSRNLGILNKNGTVKKKAIFQTVQDPFSHQIMKQFVGVNLMKTPIHESIETEDINTKSRAVSNNQREEASFNKIASSKTQLNIN
jgi:hypothetical protein